MNITAPEPERTFALIMAGKRIGIIGGAYDMVHVGHVHLANIAAKYVDEVWMMPCYKHVHGKEMTANEHRLKMLQIAAEEEMPILVKRGKVVVSDYEIRTKSTCCTYDVLVKLAISSGRIFKAPTFELIIGQDNADTIDAWQKNEELRRDFPIMVVPRGGYAKRLTGEWYHEGRHTYLADESAMELSSTDIKKMLELGRPGVGYVPQSVMNYIEQERLYNV